MGAGQAVYAIVVVAVIAVITVMLFRAFRRKDEKPWPEFFVGLYNIVLLLLYLFGMATQVSSEGFGFVPLLALTLPWSRLIEWLFDQTGVSGLGFWGSGLSGTFFINFITYNVLAGSANSFILYFLLKRRRRKVAEDEAWEQARRNR
ncbi:MAG: hypothetical protein WAM79_01690 [Candidatus Sulfotelmatobacter sp.]